MNGNSSAGCGMPIDGSPPSEAWLFAQAILGKPIPRIVSPQAKALAERRELERLARFSSSHAEALCRLQTAESEARRDRELLEWAAQISTEAQDKLRALQLKEAQEGEAWRRAEQRAEQLLEGNWDPSQHPRAPQGQADGGQWVATGGASSAGFAAASSSPLRTAAFQAGQSTAQLAAFGGAASPTWPISGPMPSWLPKADVRVGAGAAAGTVFGVIAGAFRNASMKAYWEKVPGNQAMPYIWVWELERRVRAGKLSHDDAEAIFNTAVFGAAAQGFKPTGGTMRAVHDSAVDFLGKAEAIYWARKADLKQIDRVAKKVGGLTNDQREILHQWISKENLTLEEIEELARQVKELYPNK